MNQLLQNRYNELGTEQRSELRHELKDSPMALKLIGILEQKKDKKINMIEVIGLLYGNETGFEVRRNRYFKLRRLLLDRMEIQGTDEKRSSGKLLPLEKKLFECRQLVSENHFQLAKQQLRELVNECRERNIFEIYPEAVSQLIYCNLAMNVLKENQKLADELVEASKLLHDLRLMQAIVRKLYSHVVARSHTHVHEALAHLRRIAIRRKNFPRYRLFYHFTVITNTSGIPGGSTKATARHFTSLKRLLEKHPGMPAGYYEANAATILQFYLNMAEGTHYFMKGNVPACYRLFKEAWSIQDRTPNLRIRRSESSFSNRIAIEIATGRFRDALKTAEELIEFQKEQHQEEKRLKGFADMAMIYTYSWPTLTCKDPDFIKGKLREYISSLKKNDSPQLTEALTTQAVFLFLNKEFREASKIAKQTAVMKMFSAMGLEIYNELLLLTDRSTAAEIDALKKKTEVTLHHAVSSDLVISMKRAMNLVKLVEK
ncbi:MAG: hypothetical protein HY064_00555 [Bacteroidetes bacterium]|nr:hypothetical protein [Bacteroidota bacterium]